MFCAIATTIDRCKTESVVDVFQVVKAQRLQKPGLVLTVVNTCSLAEHIHFSVISFYRNSTSLCLKLWSHFWNHLRLTQTSNEETNFSQLNIAIKYFRPY